ncbi:MAG: hypothetical protein JNJ54_05590 [Myxococcaceae bacterium]|nr:hypothetical protein [Myxococcaceae bacterium]
MKNGWVLILAAGVLPLSPGCQCVRAPDVTYPCGTSADCLTSEQCVAGLCTTDKADAGDAGGLDAGSDAGAPDAGGDAGTSDAGSDAGALDAGSDGGALDAGGDAGALDAGSDAGALDGGLDGGLTDGGQPKENCANQMDDDGDGDVDCGDRDCMQQPCRLRAHACDAEEVCLGVVCPPDGLEASGTRCDDGNRCTASDQCVADGGCEGVRGIPLYRCTQPTIEILSRGSCPVGLDFCGPMNPLQTLIAREVPDAGAVRLQVSSPGAMDGGCLEVLPDGGVALTAAVCADWVLGAGVRAGMCGTNTIELEVSPVFFPGSLPLHQFRLPDAGGPLHLFSTSPVGPPLSQPDPQDPLFFVCPP